jgi:beta-glucanase (GH16 family)
MKKTFQFASILLILSIYISCKKTEEVSNPISAQPTTPYVAPKYSFAKDPIWQDEFDKNGLPDSTKWGYDIGKTGWGNHELEYYSNKLKNAHIENGKLSIEALKEEGAQNYTSARLVTKKKGDWLYGKIEIRAKLPQGRGTWPAIWMLATNQTYGTQYWPDNGEIDIMEHVGFDPNTIHGSLHTKALNFTINTQITNKITVPTALSDFHNYTMEWYPDSIKLFVDDQQLLKFPKSQSSWERWPFDKQFHLLLNIAVGGDWGGQQGIDESIFPQKMEVEYVRVYPLIKE